MHHRLVLMCGWILLFFSSCMGIAPTSEVREVDGLNTKAAKYWYSSLDSTYYYASKAYDTANYYELGKAEACNHLGFYYFMKMDFERAASYFQNVGKYTINELELLISDVGMMKIAQRTALSKEFYDYRNSALRRMKRIDEDKSVFERGKERKRLNYAYSEFYIVSVIYFYYLQQEGLALEAMRVLDEYRENAVFWNAAYTDISQLLYYKYIKGSTGLVQGRTPAEKIVAAFDELFQTWQISRREGFIYFEANAAQGMANLLVRPQNYQLLLKERSHLLGGLAIAVDEKLPLHLANQALHLFEQYDDVYQIAGTYVTKARYFNYQNNYAEALVELRNALEQVNKHHRANYKDHHDNPDDLLPNDTSMTDVPIEIAWMEEGVLTVPEWIARIREQLSVTYAGLGNKAASDYNRNIYLDILDLVRQDKELESRYAALQAEEQFVNSLLFFLLLVLLVVGGVFIWINKRSRSKTAKYLQRLEKSLVVCRELTASLPQQASGLKDVVHPIVQIIRQFLEQELQVERILMRIHPKDEEELIYDTAPSKAENQQLIRTHFDFNIQDTSLESGLLRVFTRKKLNKEDRSFIAILSPYIVWAIENGLHYMDLGEERELLEKKLFITEQHNILQKRENIMKRACMRIVYGIQPYLDRMRNEVNKIVYADYTKDQKVRQLKYQYVDELLDTIKEYNEVLAFWIKIKQGELSLQITNFSLNDLLLLLDKGARNFEQKNLSLFVEPTDVYVKADRALTLFMLNTLLENARKFTPEGGEVRVDTTLAENYVEISVSDTGVGISAEDISKILHEKVYDSTTIGEEHPAVQAEKGSGFGLMNCKAIIDKYRKTNPLFEVCRFNIESEVGKGSRFSFRLPYGVKKTLLLILTFCAGLTWSPDLQAQPMNNGVVQHPTLLAPDSIRYQLIQEASDLADAAYFSNVDKNYTQTLDYAQQAIDKLNTYYLYYYNAAAPLMTISGEGTPAEVFWWSERVDMNYYIVLDLRNEVAVAYLALKDIDNYSYNNQAYTSLYKILSKDDSLDRVCKLLERSTSNKQVALILLLVFLGSFLIIYYVVYVRRQLLRRWSLEQVLSINERIFSASLLYTNQGEEKVTESDLTSVPHQIIEHSKGLLNELLAIDALGILLVEPEKEQLFSTLYPQETELDEALVQKCLSESRWVSSDCCEYIPLETMINTKLQVIGVFYMKRRDQEVMAEEKLFMELIVRYLATVLYNTMIRTASRFRDISLVFDDIHRLDWENSQMHVQNRVLDNCLSAIKHETIYYPSRLKQIIDGLRAGGYDEKTEMVEVKAMFDLIEYYKGVFTILSLWAKKALEYATFRRSTLEVDQLCLQMKNFFEKKNKKRKETLTLEIDCDPHLKIMGDQRLVAYLLERCLLDVLAIPEGGVIAWTIRSEGDFVSFTMVDSRRDYSEKVLNQLFYPSISRIKATPQEGLPGSTYLLAKEIIREHDEFVGRRGCRIRAFKNKTGGYALYFTLTQKK